ncbi:MULTISPECIES: GNAT family N-acetyltransferase [Pseudoalteromonas]|uniref:GNAT family N-acetyltransferase n=1 Tax=Pseudoalteromonas TaxID=53246 RepID=UPI000FFF3B11|nr:MULTISPECIES: GNAT family N-acetyltransferase [Pseudoalteromonas]NKC18133.1 GNAT family N-acetyltransferase [Pseudoalteromonas galatheae]RXE85356.1 N-acetyltransferase [Pseudoalteromonas sp. A757]
MTIVSERFKMRGLTPSDATADYLSWLNSDVSQFILNRQQTTDDLVAYINTQNNTPDTYLYGIFTKEAEQHIGNVKFILSEYSGGTSAEMGILIGDKNWHGKGVAKEVIFAFITIAKDKYNLKRVFLGVDKSNVPAVKAYIKMGFKTLEPDQLDDESLSGVKMELLLN